MRLLVSLLSLGIGAALVFLGYRFARVLITLMGFLLGLSFGGAIIADANNTVFLHTALGIIVGIVMGLLLAALAYLYYYLAITIATASLGYWAGSSLILWLGFSPGLLSVLVGLAAGVLFGIFAVVGNLPKYMLIALTSLLGAVWAVGGVMLLFHKIPLDAYSYTTANIAISNSFFWGLLAFLVFLTGIMIQMATTNDYELEEWAAAQQHPKPPAVPHTAK